MNFEKEFGAGVDRTNLTRTRKFYFLFQKGDALRQQLSWAKVSLLLEDKKE